MRRAPLLILPCLLVSCQTRPPAPLPAGHATTEASQDVAAAEARFLVGDYVRAEVLWGQIADALPASEEKARAQYWRGVCRLQQDMVRQARRDFESCASTAETPELQLLAKEGAADCERKLGNFAQAAQLYGSLAAQTPTSPKREWLHARAEECRRATKDKPGGPRGSQRGDRPDPGRAPRAPEAASAASGPFAVQLGVFAEATRARKLAAQLRSKGRPCDVQARYVGARQLYSVRSGGFNTRRQAERCASELRRIGFEAIVVP